ALERPYWRNTSWTYNFPANASATCPSHSTRACTSNFTTASRAEHVRAIRVGLLGKVNERLKSVTRVLQLGDVFIESRFLVAQAGTRPWRTHACVHARKQVFDGGAGQPGGVEPLDQLNSRDGARLVAPLPSAGADRGQQPLL